MDTSWLSTTSSGVFNYVYKHITGDEDESPGPSSSLEVLSKANVWITDLPTNNYEPLEVSHGKRRAAKKSKKERELEEDIAILNEQSDVKNKEIARLRDKVSDLHHIGQKKESDFAKEMQEKEQEVEKAKRDISLAKENCLKKESEVEELKNELKSMKDTFAKSCKPNDSLSNQIAELKNILAKRDEINNKQKELVRMLAADAQDKLKKASADITNLSEELKTCKAEKFEMKKLNISLRCREKDLKQRLNESNEKNQQQLVSMNEMEMILDITERKLDEASDALLKKDHELKSYKDRKMCLEGQNSSLEQQRKELQERLDNMTNTQVAEREESERVHADQSQQIAELSYQLNARYAELEKEIREKESVTIQLKQWQEREKQLEMMNTSLKDQRQEMQERLDDLANLQLQKREEVSLEQADLSEQIVELQNQMSSSNAEMKKDVQGENMVALLENCKEQKEKLEEACSSLNMEIGLETEDISETPADLVNTFKGGDYLKQRPPLPVAVINDAESDVEQDIPVLRKELETKKADGVSATQMVSPFYKAALKEQRENLEEACNFMDMAISLETEDISETPADVVNTFKADDYFEPTESSPFDDFLANKKFVEKPDGLTNELDNKGGDYLKQQAPLPVYVTNDAESDVEQDIPVLRKKLETKNVDEVSAKIINPFSKAALKAEGNRKPFVSMTNVVGAQVVRDIPVLRKRHETDKADGFRSTNLTVNPFSMSARAEGYQFQPRPSPFFPVTNPTASQVAQTKKDDDWLPPQTQVKRVNPPFSNVEEQGFLSRTFSNWFGF
ncbi:hypothetical protein OS493_016037 [Desmophyllum pertusum]|uniref:Uncharacterized protein n=1 Tax=Desmophyllum pertusum TaxID=174260 RepID=A0A9X0D9R5_9CNID|nr:hypothetical protein OS493_016037 [Desmophyllum pertusum]